MKAGAYSKCRSGQAGAAAVDLAGAAQDTGDFPFERKPPWKFGVMAPTGTPRAIVERLNAEITKVTNRSDVKEIWAKQGATPFKMSVADYEKYLRADIAKWAKVVKISGARADQ